MMSLCGKIQREGKRQGILQERKESVDVMCRERERGERKQKSVRQDWRARVLKSKPEQD